jgi:hypothetical protein
MSYDEQTQKAKEISLYYSFLNVNLIDSYNICLLTSIYSINLLLQEFTNNTFPIPP